MMEHTIRYADKPYGGRLETLLRFQSLFETAKTVLYIGAHGANAHCVPLFKQAKITYVEVWPANAEKLRADCPDSEIICSDIREFSTDKKFDIIMWWHGPEHLPCAQLPDTLRKLAGFGTLLILGAPIGHYPQDAFDGNPFEVHQTDITVQLLANLGFSTDSVLLPDKPDGPGTHITAWKWCAT